MNTLKFLGTFLLMSATLALGSAAPSQASRLVQCCAYMDLLGGRTKEPICMTRECTDSTWENLILGLPYCKSLPSSCRTKA